jgi:phosphatidylinositol glycan class W
MIFHQICLTFFGLTNFIQNDDRNGLLAANKEGIISLLGYLSLHLFFVEVGRFLFRMRLSFDQKIQNF